MSNKWDEMRVAYKEAEEQVRAAETVVDGMAGMIKGRLRKVLPSTLRALKRELKDFNIQTGRWK